ncbi:MAG: family transposase [Chthonomonadaceae bacterium]|nr:family transposase [Chthonomonadaceae bacterium]
MATPTLLPLYDGLHIDAIAQETAAIVLRLSTTAPYARCPECGTHSLRVHSHYRRTLADMPWNKVSVRIHLHTRKFFCEQALCKRTVFTEPVPELAARYARKTVRLQEAFYLIGYALGGEAGARIAVELGLSVSPDTLLDRVRREASPSHSEASVQVVGVDDWAFRKGQRYGTILVDLDKHEVLDLLPDRTAESLITWLKAHPGIKIVSRDRASAYSRGASEGAPEATQVADRFHLVQNAGEMLERVLHRQHRALRAAVQNSTSVPPTAQNMVEVGVQSPEEWDSEPFSAVKAQSQHRRDRRKARYESLKELQAQGLSLRAMAEKSGLSRNTVVKWIRAGAFVEIAKRPGGSRLLAGQIDYLKQRWQAGCHNAAVLYAELQARGYVGSLAVVQRQVQSWRKDLPEKPETAWEEPPSARRVRWWLLGHFHRTQPERKAEEQAFVARLCVLCPEIVSVQKHVLEFVEMIRKRQATDLPTWLSEAQKSAIPELKSFALSLQQDYAAVLAALTSAYSNGQVEGQVHRLKAVKRSMYGRAKFDLLRARVMPMRKAA